MKQMRKLRRTTVLMWILAAFLCGLVIGKTGLGSFYISAIFMLGVIALMLRKLQLRAIIIWASIGFLLGYIRGSYFFGLLAPYHALDDQRVTVTGISDSDAVYNDRQQLEFDLRNISFSEPVDASPPGVMRISGFGVPAVYRGDKVQATGRLYVSRGSRQAGISFAQIEVIKPTTSKFERLRRQFVAGMSTALPEPHASLALGILIGQRTTLPERINDRMSKVGLTHIIAVSGYNLTIIIEAVRRAGKKRSKYQKLLFSGVLMVAFLFITGFSASIVRAAVVSSLSLLAWYYGRTVRPVLLLLIAAAVTAGIYPSYIWSDIGWYLSFAAFFGVLVVAPLITARFWKNKEPRLISSVLLETICAQIMAAPIILYIFNETSLIAVLSNLLVVPIIPLAMLLSLIAGLAGMVIPMLSGWLAWPARAILTYVLDIIKILAEVPYALVKATMSWQTLTYVYLIVVFITFVLWRRHLRQRAIITDKISTN